MRTAEQPEYGLRKLIPTAGFGCATLRLFDQGSTNSWVGGSEIERGTTGI
jgi:hypothetical protein